MALISSDIVLEIKNRINIVDFISRYIQIKKVGMNFFALCPFHNEKTPSFAINPTKQYFHCYGCGISGDIFTFYQNIEKISFYEALVKLANEANIVLPNKEEKEIIQAKNKLKTEEELYKINEIANNFFIANLIANPNILNNFLENRRINKEAIEEFKIGYAPNEWQASNSDA